MTEQEQNKKINQNSRRLLNLLERIKTIELDVEPRGRIWEQVKDVRTIILLSKNSII